MRQILSSAVVMALAALLSAHVANAATAGVAQDNSEVANASILADVVGRWTGPRPPPKPRIAWADTGGFDMQVHESLGARLERIDVRVEGAYRTRAVPERMSQWLDQVRRQGGSVRTCAVDEGTRGVLGHITLLVNAVQSVDGWRLYLPVKGYSALVVVTPEDRLVRNVVFVREPKPDCPPGTDVADS